MPLRSPESHLGAHICEFAHLSDVAMFAACISAQERERKAKWLKYIRLEAEKLGYRLTKLDTQ